MAVPRAGTPVSAGGSDPMAGLHRAGGALQYRIRSIEKAVVHICHASQNERGLRCYMTSKLKDMVQLKIAPNGFLFCRDTSP